MYNSTVIARLVSLIEDNNGIADKNELAEIVKNEFGLVKKRSVYYCDDFAIRFSQSESRKMANTVLSLSSLQAYDDNPFIVCVVSSSVNYLMLANTTFLKKISHSSQELRVDNIKGSFNGSDIIMEFESLENEPASFEQLFAYHSGLTFQDNLERLVESTNGIVGRVQKFDVTASNKQMILDAVDRAISFSTSTRYDELKRDLDDRVARVQDEIAIAAFIDNVNVRGRVIEYLITDDDSTLKDQIVDSLRNNNPLPQFKTEDKLGDYSKVFPEYVIETDIKTKVLFLDGNPKAYNLDKLLEFLATDKSVYLIYLLGISDDGRMVARLCSAFDDRLIDATNMIHHWAGRNSRGVAQFLGHGLTQIINDDAGTVIDRDKAIRFIEDIINK